MSAGFHDHLRVMDWAAHLAVKRTPKVRLRCCHCCCQPGPDHMTAIHGQLAYVVDLKTPNPASVSEILRGRSVEVSPHHPLGQSAEFWSSSLAADEFRPAHLRLGTRRV